MADATPHERDLKSPTPSTQPVTNQQLRQSAAAPCTRRDQTDPDLNRIVAAWSDLPDAIRRAMRALVDSQADES